MIWQAKYNSHTALVDAVVHLQLLINTLNLVEQNVMAIMQLFWERYSVRDYQEKNH